MAGAMPQNDVVVAVFCAHNAAEDAIKQLRKSGYDITRLSIVIKDYHIEEHVAGFYNAGDRIKHWGQCGALWGGTLGLLFGAALSVIPGIGPALIGDPLAGALGAALGGAIAIGGLSAMTACVFGMSLPKDSILKYVAEIETDDQFLLVANGPSEAAEARDIIRGAPPTESTQRHQGWRSALVYGRRSKVPTQADAMRETTTSHG